MTSREFAYWLQGFFELSDAINLSAEQTKIIQAHLAMVFKHEIDPSQGSKPHQDLLSAIHGSGKADDGVIMRC